MTVVCLINWWDRAAQSESPLTTQKTRVKRCSIAAYSVVAGGGHVMSKATTQPPAALCCGQCSFEAEGGHDASEAALEGRPRAGDVETEAASGCAKVNAI